MILNDAQEPKAVRGHQFVESNYHTPSNCDVCNKTLPWSINIMRRGEGSYECQREWGRGGGGEGGRGEGGGVLQVPI